MKFKRIISVLCIVLTVSVITGCSCSSGNSSKGNSTNNQENQNAQSTDANKTGSENTDAIDILPIEVEYNSSKMVEGTNEPIFIGSYPAFDVKTQGYDKLKEQLYAVSEESKNIVNKELQEAEQEYASNPEYFPIEMQEGAEVLRADKEYTCIVVYTHNYQKGAPHATRESRYYNFKSLSGEVVNYNDIVKDKEKAYELVKSSIEQQIGSSNVINNDDLKKFIYQEGDNYKQKFYLKKDAIVFKYDHYDIAPYAAGMFSAEIPYDQL
ncbi:MAG: RsiV family protein [Lachnospiraceae bacterium]|nr:RsiV family protein [Lachnospiraceae bacterium]